MTDCVMILFCSVSVFEEGRRQTDISLPSSIWPNVSLLFFLFQVLDEEAEVFVVKMWRLLIYETEAKKLGLVK